MKKIGLGIFLLLLTASLFGQRLYPKEKKNKWGYVNSQKKFVINPIFDDAESFRNSSAIVKTGNHYNLINKAGEFLLNVEYDTLRRSGSYVICCLDSKYGILDSLGNQLSEPLFEKIDGYNGDGFTIKIDGKWVAWTLDGRVEAIEDLVFVNPDEYPVFGSNCLDIQDQEEKEACSTKALFMTIYKKITYPAYARNNGIEGTVVLRFIIKSDGSINDIKILKDVGGGCGEEALHVAKLLKVYQPPMMEGLPVAMQYTLPVKYRLE
jgi:TonB family protein